MSILVLVLMYSLSDIHAGTVGWGGTKCISEGDRRVFENILHKYKISGELIAIEVSTLYVTGKSNNFLKN